MVTVFILKDSVGFFSATGQETKRLAQERIPHVKDIFSIEGEDLKQALENAKEEARKRNIFVPDLDL